jgi:DNA-directed RNA polymerase specialized sigma24 family protein
MNSHEFATGNPATGDIFRRGMPPSNCKTQWRLLIDSLPMLHGYVCRLIGHGERAKEILQEVSLRMLATEGPEDPERYAAWGRGVARHVIAHDWRMRRRQLAEQPLENELIDEMSDGIDQEAHLDARDWIARIADDIDSDGLELLFRRYVLQETGKELADEMAQSPAAIRMRLMRLRSSASALAPRP